MATVTPDLFINVHKGLRRALFEACAALGRAGEDTARNEKARALLREALRFTTHHGENEDVLLLPMIEAASPALAATLHEQHEKINEPLSALSSQTETASTQALYEKACAFLSLYLEHMRFEEQELDPKLRALLPASALADFGRLSVARTAPDDQKMMLSWMLPAMTPDDAEAFLGRIPPHIADQLRPLTQ